MKVELGGGCYGSTELSIVVPRASWRKIFGANRERLFISAFSSLGGDSCSGPQRSRARMFMAPAERTLDGEDRCETIRQGGKSLLLTCTKRFRQGGGFDHEG